MRIGIALLMLAHGLAHVVGFAGSWQLSSKIPFKTTVFAGHVDVGTTGIRVLGVIWLMHAAAFGIAAAGAFARATWWPSLAIVIAVASLLMCIVELPDAKIGLVVNVALLAALGIAIHYGRLA